MAGSMLRVPRAGCIAAATLLLVPVTATPSAGAEGALRFTFRSSGTSGGPVVMAQESPEPFCPGVPFPFFIGFGSAPGTLFQGQLTISGFEFISPCTITAGTGTCTVDDPTTLSFSLTTDATGSAVVEFEMMIPDGSPHSGQVCISGSFTVTPPGGGPGNPILVQSCVDYQCLPVPALGRLELVGLTLLVALAAVVALSRRMS